MSDIRNFEEYRRQVLESLGEDYTVEDLRNFEKWRLKVIAGLEGISHDPEVIKQGVADWLDDHPDERIIIEDGTITDAKLASNGIKAEVTDLKSAINEIKILANQTVLKGLDWEKGSLQISDGSEYDSNTRIRTKEFIDLADAKTLTFTIDAGYKFVIDWFNSDKTKNGASPFGLWQTSNLTIDVPQGVAYMRLLVANTSDGTANVSFGSHLTIAMGDKFISFVQDMNALSDRVSKGQYVYEDVEATLTQNYAINSNRSLVSGAGNDYKISDIIPVTLGEKYRFSGDMNYGNYHYVFYDSSNTAFGGVASNSGGTWSVLEDEIIDIPPNAVGIRLGVYLNSDHTYNFEKVEPAVVADKLTNELSAQLDAKYQSKQKDWSDKTWVCVGDSLTENNATASEKYHYIIAQQTGINVLNYGKSGTGYGKTYSTSNNFADRVLELSNVDCDIITIFGSFNDMDIDLGTADDTGTSTLGGWMNTTFDNLYATKPFVSVGVILPTPWWGRTPDGSTEGRLKAVQYCEMLLEICRRRSIPVLDLFHNSNFHPNESNYRDEFFYQADGTHPNNKGHAKIAPMVLEFLKGLIEL